MQFYLFLIIYLFIFKGFYLFVNILLTIPYLFMLLRHIYLNHLYIIFISNINYPYDTFSMIIDILLIFIKLFISISSNTSKETLSKLFFIISFIILFFLQIYLTYIMIEKSYFLMNNILLNKFRYSILLTQFIIIIIILFLEKDKIWNVYYIICFFNVLILCLLFIGVFYDPYQFIKFDNDENIENVYYYFFVIERDKNKNLIIETKLKEHINKCNKCILCKKYNEIKLKNEYNSNGVDLYYIICDGKNILMNLMNKIIRKIKFDNNELDNNSFIRINLIYLYYLSIIQKDYCFSLNIELIYHILNQNEDNKYKSENEKQLNKIHYTSNFIIKANKILEILQNILKENNEDKKNHIIFELGNLLDQLKSEELKLYNNSINNNNENIFDKTLNNNNSLIICSIFYEELYNESISHFKYNIRDNQNVLDDLINNINRNNNYITFEINFINFQVKIIRAAGEMNKYENLCLLSLFPEIFNYIGLFYLNNL